MNFFVFVVKFKNFIKSRSNSENKFYLLLQLIYRKAIFPLERKNWQQYNDVSFESVSSLHMCSLLPKKTLDLVIDTYQPKTWLDVGCGTGTSLKYLKKKGIQVTGVEYSELAINISGLEEHIYKYNLTESLHLNHSYDLVWCYEVAEHIPEKFSNILVESLIRHSKRIVFSAAIPGQGGEGHVNEQPVSYWIEKFIENGYIIDETLTLKIHKLKELYSDNVYCFFKQ